MEQKEEDFQKQLDEKIKTMSSGELGTIFRRIIRAINEAKMEHARANGYVTGLYNEPTVQEVIDAAEDVKRQASRD